MGTLGQNATLTGLLECVGEGTNRGEAVLWSLGQGYAYHVFDVR